MRRRQDCLCSYERYRRCRTLFFRDDLDIEKNAQETSLIDIPLFEEGDDSSGRFNFYFIEMNILTYLEGSLDGEEERSPLVFTQRYPLGPAADAMSRTFTSWPGR